MISFYPFLYSSHAHTNERNKVKTRVDNFIQITVFCHPSLNKVDTFVYWNAAKAYSYTCYLMIYLLVIYYIQLLYHTYIFQPVKRNNNAKLLLE